MSRGRSAAPSSPSSSPPPPVPSSRLSGKRGRLRSLSPPPPRARCGSRSCAGPPACARCRSRTITSPPSSPLPPPVPVSSIARLSPSSPPPPPTSSSPPPILSSPPPPTPLPSSSSASSSSSPSSIVMTATRFSNRLRRSRAQRNEAASRSSLFVPPSISCSARTTRDLSCSRCLWRASTASDWWQKASRQRSKCSLARVWEARSGFSGREMDGKSTGEDEDMICSFFLFARG
mmetsp:Transcript_45131/g.88297  ORF Transcript_45131/g.88297 Transcript_45131/m.88297 type:complete len:233 (+) Transcript_45131:1-699(+)